MAAGLSFQTTNNNNSFDNSDRKPRGEEGRGSRGRRSTLSQSLSQKEQSRCDDVQGFFQIQPVPPHLLDHNALHADEDDSVVLECPRADTVRPCRMETLDKFNAGHGFSTIDNHNVQPTSMPLQRAPNQRPTRVRHRSFQKFYPLKQGNFNC